MADVANANYIFASLFTGVYDVNRNELLNANDFSIIEKWYNSILKLQLNAIVFHNTFSDELVQHFTTDKIQFVKVEYDGKLNPNIFRYIIYQQFLKSNLLKIDNLFMTDITDVEVLQNPFNMSYYLENTDCLFCGDEPETMDTIWMKNHCEHLRNSITDFVDFENANKHKTLLNCGVIGGTHQVILSLLDKMVAIHQQYSYSNRTPYTLDMGVFNYVARKTFGNTIRHGNPINTIFKMYEHYSANCWFRHK